MNKPVLQPYSGEKRGILNPHKAEQVFQLTRYSPSEDLAAFINRYWIVRWDLRGQPPYMQHTLDYPCINLVFERGHTAVFGPETGRTSKVLEGKSKVFGIKFWPGGFYPFVQMPLYRFTDRAISLEETFGIDHQPLEEMLNGLDDDAAMVEYVETFLRSLNPTPDPMIVRIREIVDCISNDRSILRVDDLARQTATSKRTLQRLFSQYVGVTPKWAIQRCRLHEAAATLADNPDGPTWSVLALDLGYFDQAHFIKDFKTVIGKTPTEYVRALSG